MSDHMQQAREMLRSTMFGDEAPKRIAALLAERDAFAEKVKHAEMAASAEGNYADDLKRQCAALAARVGVLEGALKLSLAAMIRVGGDNTMTTSRYFEDLAPAIDAARAALASPIAPVEAAPEAPVCAECGARHWQGQNTLCQNPAPEAPAEPEYKAPPMKIVGRLNATWAKEPAEPLAPSDAARAEGAEQMRDVLQRCVKGIDHLSELARLWEPDHSSGADRRGWVLAKDARDDAAELLRPLPVEAPNVRANRPIGAGTGVAMTDKVAGPDGSALSEGLGLGPERATVSLTLADLQMLAVTASRNDTHHAFQAVALEWCGKAQAEIERLNAQRRELQAERERLLDSLARAGLEASRMVRQERHEIAQWLEGQGQPGYAHEVRFRA